MGKLWGLAGAVVSLLLASSCDTTQPLDAGQQTFSITMEAFADTEAFDIWDVLVDTTIPPDGVPDVEADFKRCVVSTSSSAGSAPVPWNYSAEISVVRAGSTTEEVVESSVDGPRPFSSLTPYDDTLLDNTDEQPLPPFEEGSLFFVNGRTVTTGNRDFIESCAGIALSVSEPNVLGQPGAFNIVLNPGDTIIVRARKQLVTRSEVGGLFRNGAELSSGTSLDGRAVLPKGTLDTDDEDGSGLSYSFTLQ